MPERIKHIDDHPLVQSLDHEIASDPGLAGEGRNWDMLLDMYREVALVSHRAALLTVYENHVTNRPFALYLRSFEMEAYNYFTPKSLAGEQQVVAGQVGPSRLEKKLYPALPTFLPIIGVANPATLSIDMLIPRLQIPDKDWQERVGNLISDAHIIVVECETLAPGLLWELESIRRRNKQEHTVIILQSQEDDFSGETVAQSLARVAGAEIVKRERPTTEHAEFSAFRRVTYESDISLDHLDDSPLFSDLLASAAEQGAESPPFDPIVYATRCNEQGLDLAEAKQYAAAFEKLEDAVQLRRCVNDRPGLMASLTSIGSLYLELRQFENALPVLDESFYLAREIGNARFEGLTAGLIGIAHQELRQYEAAIQWFLHANRLHCQNHAQSEILWTLRHLVELYHATDQEVQARECCELLLACQQKLGDRAGEIIALLELSKHFCWCGLLDSATNFLKEACNLSRDVGDPELQAACTAMSKHIRSQSHRLADPSEQ
jgi:tetratricopeptide (TPR) repeat protein